MYFPKTLSSCIAIATLALSGCSVTPNQDTKEASWIDGPCSSENPGVTLSVDFRGEVTTHCALDFEGNGWELFEAAGFLVRGTSKYPSSFACQINQQPADASCDDSASSSAYWGYYLPTDGTWGYASTGASDHSSKCGSWEGWVYMETENTKSNLPKPSEFVCG